MFKTNSFLNVLSLKKMKKIIFNFFYSKLSSRMLWFFSSQKTQNDLKNKLRKKYVFFKLWQVKNTFFSQKNLQTKDKVLKNIIFCLNRVEEKIKKIKVKNNNILLEKLLLLRNLILNFFFENYIYKKFKNVLIFDHLNKYKFKKVYWIKLFSMILKKNFNENLNKNKQTSVFVKKVFTNLQKYGVKKRKRIIKAKKNNNDLRLTDITVSDKNLNLTLKGQKQLLSFLSQRKVNLIYINIFSISKFILGEKMTQKKVFWFFKAMERNLMNQFKYVGVLISDCFRIGYSALLFKNLNFLANFIVFQMTKLPKNRKQTKFISFIIKIILVIAKHRREITGIRLYFKGRVNKCNRTKPIIGQTGLILVNQYDSRIEYGTAKALTRKGILGIKIWVCYKNTFQKMFKENMLRYFVYVKNMRVNSLKNFNFNFVLN